MVVGTVCGGGGGGDGGGDGGRGIGPGGGQSLFGGIILSRSRSCVI